MAERTRRGRQKQAEMMLITMKAMILKNQNKVLFTQVTNTFAQWQMGGKAKLYSTGVC
jgi:hypothetical protein